MMPQEKGPEVRMPSHWERCWQIRGKLPGCHWPAPDPSPPLPSQQASVPQPLSSSLLA